MEFTSKHTYSIDIIELKLGLDDIINNSPNINNLTDFENNYTIIIEKAINQLIDKNFIKKSELKEILKNKLYLPIKENDISETLFFILLSYQLIIKDTYLAPLILDFHYSFSLEKNNFIDNIEFGLIENTKINLKQLDFDENLLHKIAKWCSNKREIDNYNYKEFSSNDDNRISCDIEKEQIERYFMQLSKYKGDENINQAILSKENVKRFLHSNFIGFEPRYSIKKLSLNINTVKPFNYFIYNFFTNQISKQQNLHKKIFVDLIFNNFTNYDKIKRNHFISNFSNKPAKPLLKYLYKKG